MHKFINNRVTRLITTSEVYIKQINELKISWSNQTELVRKLYQILEDSDVYSIYMNEKDDSFRNDKRIVQFLFSELLYNSEDFYSGMEEQSIFWCNYIYDIITKISYLIDNIKKDHIDSLNFPEIFKKDDDKDFVIDLLRNTLIHTEEYTEIINKNIINWDIDRIADTDRIVMLAAISEIIKFPSIPIKVTFNEYIEIAKIFGSDKSGGFINGILDKIIKHLEEEKLFKKTGRGLIDN